MSKGKRRPSSYNRQSKGFQQNFTKAEMKKRNAELPKQIDAEKLTKRNKILGILWGALVIALAFFTNWGITLIAILIGAGYMAWFFYYMQSYQTKFIRAYKKMDVTKEMYIKQLRKNGVDKKSIDRISKAWDKVKIK